MEIIATCLYVLGGLDFLLLASCLGLNVWTSETLLRAITWPVRTVWLLVDEIIPGGKL